MGNRQEKGSCEDSRAHGGQEAAPICFMGEDERRSIRPAVASVTSHGAYGNDWQIFEGRDALSDRERVDSK